MKTGIELITDERNRQVTQEGYSPEHDDEHTDGQLVDAAISYAYGGSKVPIDWPWDHEQWKPKDEITDLARAGALLAAEIDRLKRLEGK